MKRSNIRCVVTLVAITCISCSIFAQMPSGTNENDPVLFEASYVADNINNVAGGIKTGSCYLGMANMMLGIDTEKVRLWNRGLFYINAANTQGASPSAELLGDMQIVSNIEAGNHTYLQEVWFKQQVGNLEFTIGLQDLNVDFANSKHGALFLNSSFGILPVISANFTAPIFPLTTPGLTTKWGINKNLTWVNAIYDGSPTDFDYNPYNLNWQFNSGDGLLVISELQKKITINQLPGVCKAGVYSHFHRKGIKSTTPDSLINYLFGCYTYADQTIWEQGNKNAGLFVQLGYSPSDAGLNKYFVGTGINISGLLCKKTKDIFGLAVAHVIFNHYEGSETAIELTYQYRLTGHIFIQPDFQYIVHPAGMGEPLPNALAANFRFGFNF